jgi:hypothetical protein
MTRKLDFAQIAEQAHTAVINSRGLGQFTNTSPHPVREQPWERLSRGAQAILVDEAERYHRLFALGVSGRADLNMFAYAVLRITGTSHQAIVERFDDVEGHKAWNFRQNYIRHTGKPEEGHQYRYAEFYPAYISPLIADYVLTRAVPALRLDTESQDQDTYPPPSSEGVYKVIRSRIENHRRSGRHSLVLYLNPVDGADCFCWSVHLPYPHTTRGESAAHMQNRLPFQLLVLLVDASGGLLKLAYSRDLQGSPRKYRNGNHIFDLERAP